MHKLNIALIIHNEAPKLEALIVKYKEFANVYILDNESTDGSTEIAIKNGATVIRGENARDPWNRENIQSIINAINTDWLIITGANEIYSTALLNTINGLIAKRPELHGIKVPRQSYTYGMPTHISYINYYKYAYLSRIFARYARNTSYTVFNVKYWMKDYSVIHFETPLSCAREKVVFLPVRDETTLRHFRDGSCDVNLAKDLKYSLPDAKNRISAGKTTSLLNIFIGPIFSSVKWLLSSNQNKESYYAILLHFHYEFITRLQMYQIQSQTSSEVKTRLNEQIRQKYLTD
jgi:glycosyltransferase involved in cell wall biosynthesis